jgi:hypothetical protein
MFFFVKFRVLSKDRMKLYQHSAHCAIAMQIFLDANPQYWRFVPMTIEESNKSAEKHIERLVFADESRMVSRSKDDCEECIGAVPQPPTGYIFSNRQLILQTQYFHNRRDKDLPRDEIDLYNATIIAVRK